jgi:hypothetical protein
MEVSSHTKFVLIITALAIAGCSCIVLQTRNLLARPALPLLYQPPSGGGEIAAIMVGHQYRQDDLPSIAKAPDGSLWIAWLSFGGYRDDIAIRHYRDGRWSNIQWTPNSMR